MRVADKVATIVPRAHLSLTRYHTYFMALSYICVHADYVAFFRARSREDRYVILDNSTVELGEPEPFEDYVRKAIDMEASCIVLPDWLHERSRTLQDAIQGIATARTLGYSGDLMAVPQGNDHAEWLASCNELSKLGGVDIIGLSYRYNDMFSRRMAMHSASIISPKPMHLLGCRANPYYEASDLLRLKASRGVDSAFVSAITKAGLRLTRDTERVEGVSSDIMNDKYDPILLQDNIYVYRMLCGGYEG